MSIGAELWRGAAQAWECDHLGHLNTRFYLAKIEQALPALGAVASRRLRTQHLRFHREVRTGAPLYAIGGWLSGGGSAGERLIALHHAQDDALAMTCRLRHGDAAGQGDVPEGARERGLSLNKLAATKADGDEAARQGLARTGLTAILSDQCDADGAWRLSAMMGLIADASLHLRHGDWREVLARTAGPEPLRIGNVLLEIGIVHHRWPAAGDAVEVRSALAECTSRITRTAHWLLDPTTGRPWAAAATVGMPMDLDARRAVALTPEAQAAFRAVAAADA